MAASQLKVPAVITTGIICFLGGVVVGVVVQASLDVWQKERYAPLSEENQDQSAMYEKMAKMKMSFGKGKGGQGKGGGKGKGGGMVGLDGIMRFPPQPRGQLASLVTKLDQLTRKPLAIHLSDEQRAKLRPQLAGLDKEDLSDEEAQKRLDAILEIVKADKPALEAAGFSWPGSPSAPPPTNEGNPFTSEQNSKHLKSLQEQVKEKGS
jgi:hypothetical protein